MPLVTITDWANGPMGPGFFLLYPRHVDIFYDGGPFHALLGNDDRVKKKEQETDVLVALSLLMLDP